MSFTFAYLTPTKIYTTNKFYPNTLTKLKTYNNYVLIKESTQPELFFDNKVFNTYVISEEENVYILYHINNELVFADKSVKLNYDTIYVVEIVEQTSTYKKVTIYKPMIYKGIVKKGIFTIKESFSSQSDNFVDSQLKIEENKTQPDRKKVKKDENNFDKEDSFEDKCFGLVKKGRMIYRNVHEENDLIYTICINSNTFLEYLFNLNYLVTGKILSVDPIKVNHHNLTITVLENLPPTFLDKSNKLFFNNPKEKYVDRMVKVRIIKERLGMLLGTFDLGVTVGEVRIAYVTRITDKIVFLEISGMKGRMLRNELSHVNPNQNVRGIITKVENGFFELSVKKLKAKEVFDELEKPYFELPFGKEESFCDERSLL